LYRKPDIRYKYKERSSRVTPENLAQRWGIHLIAAKETIKVTTQKGIHYSVGPPERRFKTKQAQLRYHQLSGRHGRFYTDTMFSSFPTISRRKMAQLYINDQMSTRIYPVKNKSDIADTLQSLMHEIGIPHTIHSDNAKELTQGRFKSLCSDFSIPCTLSEPYSPCQNRVESGIREPK
jgi:transposase InsO family protein